MIDTKNIDFVKKHHWVPNTNKSSKDIYVQSHIPDTIKLHRYLLNCPKGLYVDHINHNTLDNRESNLRICSNKQNCENRKGAYTTNTTSSIRNICWDKNRGKWLVSITHKGKHIHGGRFDNLEEAMLGATELRDQYFTHHKN